MGNRPTANSLRKQVPDEDATELWSAQVGNVCSVLLHREVPFVPRRPRVHAPRGQPGPIMA